VSLPLILDALADQIRTRVSSSDWDFQVEPRMVVNPTPPSVDMYPADPARDTETGNFGATAEEISEGYWVNVRARCAVVDGVAQQDVLLELKDDTSEICLVQALYDDPTLGGLAYDVALDQESGFVLFPTIDGGAVHVGVLWRFLVLPAHS
jgi:hypothetical protein